MPRIFAVSGQFTLATYSTLHLQLNDEDETLWLWRDHRKLHLICLPFIYRAPCVLASLVHFSLKQEGKLNRQPSPSVHAGSPIQRHEIQLFVFPRLLLPPTVLKWFPLLWGHVSLCCFITQWEKVQALSWLCRSKAWGSLLVRVKSTSSLIWTSIISSIELPLLQRVRGSLDMVTSQLTSKGWVLSLLGSLWPLLWSRHRRSVRQWGGIPWSH